MTVEAIRSGIDLSYVDAGARPQDDLFGHVNGRWLADHGCPPTAPPTAPSGCSPTAPRSRYATSSPRPLRRRPPKAPIRSASAICTPASWTPRPSRGLGVRPLLDELAGIDAALTPAQLAAELGELQRTGIGGGTGVYVDTDAKDSTRYLLHMSQSGLGLPDESYYRDPQHAAILAEYPKHIARMFALVYGEQEADWDATAAQIVALETKIAAAHWDVVKRRDADLTYNLRTFDRISLGGNRFRLGRVAARVGR